MKVRASCVDASNGVRKRPAGAERVAVQKRPAVDPRAQAGGVSSSSTMETSEAGHTALEMPHDGAQIDVNHGQSRITSAKAAQTLRVGGSAEHLTNPGNVCCCYCGGAPDPKHLEPVEGSEPL